MWKIIAVPLFGISLFGEDLALARLKHEMAVAREQEKHAQQFGENGAARIEAVHAALRDWLEPQLPKDAYSLAGEVSRLDASLPKQLMEAGLLEAKSTNIDSDLPDPAFDHLSDPAFSEVGLELKMMPEMPDLVFVTATVGVPCGYDQAVYAYRFDSNGRTREIEDHPKSDWGYASARLKLSDPDSQGRRLLLIDRSSTQCASTWMGMTYAVYQMSLSKPPETLLNTKHGFWLGNDGPEFVLKPDELTIEFLDTSVGVHNRTYIFRYSFADGVKRLEPLVFQPQDFAEEWLTQPWSEVGSRSAPETQKWHAKLHADFVLGSYTNVVLCPGKPDRWSIGFEISHIGEKELTEPMRAHLLVRDLGNYHFEMEAVSDSEFGGCPGHGEPSDKHPWLSVEQLKALP